MTLRVRDVVQLGVWSSCAGNAMIIGFADYLAVVMVVKQPGDVYANATVSAVKTWLEMVELYLT